MQPEQRRQWRHNKDNMLLEACDGEMHDGLQGLRGAC